MTEPRIGAFLGLDAAEAVELGELLAFFSGARGSVRTGNAVTHIVGLRHDSHQVAAGTIG